MKIDMGASTFQLALPSFPIAGRSVLDIGCSTGESLMHPYYSAAVRRCGMDVDRQAIENGRHEFPDLELQVADAEHLPYSAEEFDVVISKVALLYTDIRKSFAEIFRVMKPGGDVFLTMHDLRLQWIFFSRAVKAAALRRVIDHGYIVGASAIYIATGRIPARPWSGTRETFQSVNSLRRDLTLAGFVNQEFQRTARDFIVSAHKP